MQTAKTIVIKMHSIAQTVGFTNLNQRVLLQIIVYSAALFGGAGRLGVAYDGEIQAVILIVVFGPVALSINVTGWMIIGQGPAGGGGKRLQRLAAHPRR